MLYKRSFVGLQPGIADWKDVRYEMCLILYHQSQNIKLDLSDLSLDYLLNDQFIP